MRRGGSRLTWRSCRSCCGRRNQIRANLELPPAIYSSNMARCIPKLRQHYPYRAATCDTVCVTVRSLALYATMPAKAMITTTTAANTQPTVSILHSGLFVSRAGLSSRPPTPSPPQSGVFVKLSGRFQTAKVKRFWSVLKFAHSICCTAPWNSCSCGWEGRFPCPIFVSQAV